MALVCITSHGSLQSWAKQQKSLGLQFHPQLRDIRKEFPSLPLLVALKWVLGANPLSRYSLGQKCQCSPSLLSPWMGSVNTSPSHPGTWRDQSSVAEAAQHSLGFLPREHRGNPVWWQITRRDALWTPTALSPSTHLSSSCCCKKRLLECSEVMYYVVAFCQFSEKFFYLFFRIKALKPL